LTANRWLAVAAGFYSVLHHEGTLLADAGETVDRTRWADWVDLSTPYLILLPIALALHALAADRLAWGCYLVGALTYAEGHGIHLSSNSIGNVRPPDEVWPPIVHLWDEVVGHYLWSAGVLLVVLAVARAAHDRPPPPSVAYLLALTVGFTWFTNSIEGGTPILGILGATVLTAVGWTHRHGFDRTLLVAYAPALVLFLGFGLWQGGFPQFTELGWA